MTSGDSDGEEVYREGAGEETGGVLGPPLCTSTNAHSQVLTLMPTEELELEEDTGWRPPVSQGLHVRSEVRHGLG